MKIEIMSFILGAILLAVGLLGGGIQIKEIKIPQVSRFSRILSGCSGIVFILLGLYIAEIFPEKQPTIPGAEFNAEIADSNESGVQKADDNRIQPVNIYSQGNLVIRGTWSCDLDQGLETETGADFWWEQETETIRYIVPRNGARFCVPGLSNFNSITPNNLAGLAYSSAKINGSNTASNRIPKETIIAVITSEGRYCKFKIDDYGYNLHITWVTYSRAG